MNAWRETPTLTGRHVTLRPLDRADRDQLLATFADGFEQTFSTVVPGPDTIDAWYDLIEVEREAGRVLPFAVLDQDGRIVGTTRFLRVAERHRRLEIGGTLYAARVRRTGLNTEAKRLLLSHAFDTLHALCVQLRTDWLNAASSRAIERLGARQDGVLRGHMLIGEHRRDTVVYSILAHEWPGVRRNLDGLLASHG